MTVAALMNAVDGGSTAIHLMIFAGLANLVGGALRMAGGEYVSVALQKDAEQVCRLALSQALQLYAMSDTCTCIWCTEGGMKLQACLHLF